MISAGQLNQRITIQQATRVRTDQGETTRTWSTYAAGIPVKVESVTGGETIRGRQVSAEATTMFTSRFLAGVSAEMRVLYEGRVLNLVRVGDPYGDRRELRMEARE